ncbi:MAG: ATPase [Sedimenticola sp.]|nr:ATPase [Sedimenticola sp.]
MNTIDPTPLQEETPTRMLFMGEAALTEGFRLIGFETWADATRQELDELLQGLLKKRQKAFIVLGQALAGCDSALLQQVRAEGGRIIVTQVPSLADPDNFQCEIDDRLQILLGGAVQLDRE